MAIVRIPSLASSLTGGETWIEVEGRTVSELVVNLERMYPGMSTILGDESSLRPGIAVAVDGVIHGREIFQALKADSEVYFMPAIFSG